MKKHTRLTVLAAVIIFCLSAFFAGGATGQSRAEVDAGYCCSGTRECSIAIEPDNTGNILVSSLLAASSTLNPAIFTQVSTNAGATWLDPQTQIPNPNSATYNDAMDDEKLAFRSFESSPEVLIVFRAQGAHMGTGVEGTFVNWAPSSAINTTTGGIGWQTGSSIITVETHDASTGDPVHTVRPSIATDNSNNAWITYTSVNSSTGESDVRVAEIAGGVHALASGFPTTIETSGSSGDQTFAVDACGIVTDVDGNVYILWRKTWSDNTRDLLIDEITSGGTTTFTAVSGSTKPSVPVCNPDEGGSEVCYQDYPSLTISGDPCNPSLFIAYTELPASPTNNPSDLFLTSAPVASLSIWSTKLNINADAVTESPSDGNYVYGTTINPYTFQFEPELAPDGFGGVFLLYYSEQPNGTPIFPCAILYESGNHGPQHTLSAPSTYNQAYNVTDYCGIAWDPVQQLVHPIWTDYPDAVSGTNGMFSMSVPPGPFTSSTNPDVGSLGFSCKRASVMTGETAHAVAVNDNAIEYTEQNSYKNTTDGWTTPLRLDAPADRTTASSPCIAGYVKDASANQTAVAVAWSSEYIDVSGNNYDYIDVCVKEDPCGEWSGIFSIPNATCSCTETIVPLTIPVNPSTPTINRYLLGWIITWEDPGLNGANGTIKSVALLRGGQSSGQFLVNDNWGEGGTYSSYTITNPSTVLSNITPVGVQTVLSVTSNENNMKLSDHSNEIIYSSDGTGTGASDGTNGFYSGCKAVNAQYYVSGTTLGNFESITTGSQQTLAPIVTGQFDCNPSVTVTSSGQNIAAWEHLGPEPPLPGIFPFPLLSSIRIANSNPPGSTTPWSILQDFITQPYATDPTFHWLVNPSVTAFPKTTAGTASGTSDPHGAELLFTLLDQFCYCSPAPGYSGLIHVNDLHERLFDWKNTNPQNWNTGTWTTGDQSPFPVSGINSQRSFGLYTTGPQYHSTDPLPYVGATGSVQYTHGLTYGIGNSTTDPLQFVTATIGAFKGTFAHPLGEDLYRVEDRCIDTSSVEFQWGGVYVEDTALGLPPREVMLHNGQPDSTGFVSHDAIRDSIFATEWFDWPVSAEITYNRWMGISTGSFTDSVVDSIVCGSSSDTSSDSSTTTYTTIPVYHEIPSHQGDAEFAMNTSLTMQYTVQLIHQNGVIDTVDQMIYHPYLGQEITPHTVHIVNANYAADTVMLRVVGNFTGIPDADSNVVFGLEEMLDTIGDLGDTTIALGAGGFVPDTGCFNAIGPYPDPSAPSGDNISILVHYCTVGAVITAQVYNTLGGSIGSPITFTSDGQTWDRLEIPAPSSAGPYYIHVNVGAFSSTLSYSVY